MAHDEYAADATTADQLEVLRTLATDAFSQIDQGLGIEVAGIAELSQLFDSIEHRVALTAQRPPATPTTDPR